MAMKNHINNGGGNNNWKTMNLQFETALRYLVLSNQGVHIPAQVERDLEH